MRSRRLGPVREASFYAFHVTFEGQSGLYRLAERYRNALAGMDALTLIPDRWLHLTMQGLGFADEIPLANAEAVAGEAASIMAAAPIVAVSFGEIVVADEAIALPAEPAEPIREVRTATRLVIATVLGSTPDDAGAFRPHVSVAYFAGEGPAEPYVRAVEAVRPEPVQINIRSIELVRMHRDHQMYEWDVVASIPLG
jgi:2'-5' RNA ligase